MVKILHRRWRSQTLIVSVTFVCLLIILHFGVNVFPTARRLRIQIPKNFGHEFVNLSANFGHKFVNVSAKVEQACIHPTLPLWTDQSQQRASKCPKIVCADEENWVYTSGGRFYISGNAVAKHGDIVCKYSSIFFKDGDDRETDRNIVTIQNGTFLRSDAFKVLCTAHDGAIYANVHATITPSSRPTTLPAWTDGVPYNVLMFGFDSLSRQAVKRLMPNSHQFFTQTLGGVVLEGYNIVGDGTPQALMPILTGRTETEIPEVRRGKPDAQTVDTALEFIWKRYEKRGYITQWGEDMANIGTFNMRMLGFKDQPVHHYLRPFYLEAIRIYPKFRHFCLGSKPRHQLFIDWIKEGIDTNNGHPFFTFGFFAEYSHSSNECVTRADNDMVTFLRQLSQMELFDRTFLVFMSDHGARFGPMRGSEQGKLEERMPYFGVYVPEKFRAIYPLKYQTFLQNSKRLTAPFDIYKTFVDILGEKDVNDVDKGTGRTSYSLFAPIPASRTCPEAGIEPHWCACLNSKDVSVLDSHVMLAAEHALAQFNSYLEPHSDLCHTLTKTSILKAKLLETNDQVLKFKKSSDNDGRVADLSDDLNAQYLFYQITMETAPGGGIFEMTSMIDVITNTVTMESKDVSRINRYNDAPKCIENLYPALRSYCFCRT